MQGLLAGVDELDALPLILEPGAVEGLPTTVLALVFARRADQRLEIVDDAVATRPKGKRISIALELPSPAGADVQAKGTDDLSVGISGDDAIPRHKAV